MELERRSNALPFVTIGVCVRNCTSTIREAIESIMAQDYPHELMEVIFVDDGSKDNTLSIIKEYASKMDMKVKIFHHEWKGLGPSRNVVIKNASGKYILWVDGDMIIPKDHVNKQVEFMEENPKVGIGKASYNIYNQNNLVSFLEDVGYIAVDYKYRGEVDAARGLGTGGSIYRVEAIKEIGGFDEYVNGACEDTEVEFRIQRAGWKLYKATPAHFYERRRKNWADLWKEYVWIGYGGYRVYQKNKKVFNLLKLTPLAGFIAGAWYSTIAYKVTLRKIVFLLPLQYAFKRIAWCYGFMKGQMRKLTL
ncbi:MAG: glycosyltransferase [Nitrososphaeria archaeon]